MEDLHKKQFALGFEFYFLIQGSKLNQKGFAIEAGVKPGDISNIRRGNEKKFPGYKKQMKIAAAFDKEVHELVFKGREIEAGKVRLPEAKYTPSVKATSVDARDQGQAYDAPFPQYFEVMKLKYKHRPMLIMQTAAKEAGFDRVLSSYGDQLFHEGKHADAVQRFLDQKMTEKDLYQIYLTKFKELKEKIRRHIANELKTG